MSKTVMEHVISCLKAHGVKDVFGVAGDFAFGVEEAICADKEMRWIGNCNELNAAYAADGYARVKGLAALSTTYGVGELSAMNGVAGAYSEHVPVIHIVGMPETGTRTSKRLLHHTLGDREFDVYLKMYDSVVCASTVLTAENAVAETERLISAAIENQRPVYMGVPKDVVSKPIVDRAAEVEEDSKRDFKSDESTLESVTSAISDILASSKQICILPGVLVTRRRLQKEVTALVEKLDAPFATLFMDKAVLDENHPNYVGMYYGKLANEGLQKFIAECDCVFYIGSMLSDVNTGYFSAELTVNKMIHIELHRVRVRGAVYENVAMRDVLMGLLNSQNKLTKSKMQIPDFTRLWESAASSKPPSPDKKITVEYLYSRWQKMLRPNDMVLTDTGSTGMGLSMAKMPSGASFQNQTLWAAIGWATPASLGMSVAHPSGRMILVTGEGAHQMTAQEICQFQGLGLKPLIFVVNNQGYLIERLLCKTPEAKYNNLAQWKYAKLPEALGCDDWFTCRVETCEELDQAITRAEAGYTAAYIEVITSRYAAPPWFDKVHETVRSTTEA